MARYALFGLVLLVAVVVAAFFCLEKAPPPGRTPAEAPAPACPSALPSPTAPPPTGGARIPSPQVAPTEPFHPPGKDFTNGLGTEMVWIPPGSFRMGSPPEEPGRKPWEGPVHSVTIAEGFWLSRLELTQEAYQSVAGDNPSRTTAPGFPVFSLTWDQATTCVADLTRMEREAGRLDQGWIYTLPSEAQWEYACRAGTTGPVYSNEELASVAQHRLTSGARVIVTGGSLVPNAFGLHDMLGNIEEWVQDTYIGSYVGAPGDGSVREGPQKHRVARGAGFRDRPGKVRAAFRRPLSRDNPGPGIRLALVQESTRR